MFTVYPPPPTTTVLGIACWTQTQPEASTGAVCGGFHRRRGFPSASAFFWTEGGRPVDTPTPHGRLFCLEENGTAATAAVATAVAAATAVSDAAPCRRGRR